MAHRGAGTGSQGGRREISDEFSTKMLTYPSPWCMAVGLEVAALTLYSLAEVAEAVLRLVGTTSTTTSQSSALKPYCHVGRPTF